MKKLENQTVYQCSYCTKISKSATGLWSIEPRNVKTLNQYFKRFEYEIHGK